jgi:hypothetical protein
MKAFLIALGTTKIKCNWVESSNRVLCHKIKRSPLHTTMHSCEGSVVVRWLMGNVTKSFGRETSANPKKLLMVVSLQAWVLQNCMVHVSEGILCLMCP